MAGIKKATHYSRLLDLSGAYVVRFPDRVKVGHSIRTWHRILQHVLDGATDATVFEIKPAPASSPSRSLRDFERQAVDALAAIATRVPGTTESFAGIEYRRALRVVRRISGYAREVDFPRVSTLYQPPPYLRAAELGIPVRQLLATGA